MTQIETSQVQSSARETGTSEVKRNIETVKAIYSAFGRGDVPAVLATLAPDVDWETDAGSHGIPWLQPGRGHAAALRFFEALGANVELTDFRVLGVMGDGEWVVALVAVTVRVRATGKSYREACEPHVWRFDASGRVISMRHGADTHRHLAALS